MNVFCWWMPRSRSSAVPFVPYPGQLFGVTAGAAPWPTDSSATVKVLDVRDGWVLFEVPGAKRSEVALELELFHKTYKRRVEMNQRLRDYIERAVADRDKISTDVSYKSIESAFATVDGFRTWLDEKYPELAVGEEIVFDDNARIVTVRDKQAAT